MASGQNRGTYVPPTLDDDEQTGLLSNEEYSTEAKAKQEGGVQGGQEDSKARNTTSQVQGMMHLPQLPSAAEEWHRHRPLVTIWGVMSGVVCFVSFPFIFGEPIGFLGFVAGVLGITASSMILCECCQNHNLSQSVQTTFILALISMALDCLAALLFISSCISVVVQGCPLEDEEECLQGLVIMVLLFYGLVFIAHGAISYQVAQKARAVKRVLDPVSNGVVVLA